MQKIRSFSQSPTSSLQTKSSPKNMPPMLNQPLNSCIISLIQHTIKKGEEKSYDKYITKARFLLGV